MIVGGFVGRYPLVKARLQLPTLGAEGQVIFLLDTGAHTSCVMPDDGRLLRIDYGRLTGASSQTRGLGGSVASVSVPAALVFAEDNGVHRVYEFIIDVMPDTPALQEMPSLLGQDILAHWRVTHSPGEGLLQAEVLSAHRTHRTG